MLVGTIVFGALAGGFFCCICCGYKSLKMAIDVIDNLSERLEEISNVEEIDGHVIKKDVLDKINSYYDTNTLNNYFKKNLINNRFLKQFHININIYYQSIIYYLKKPLKIYLYEINT